MVIENLLAPFSEWIGTALVLFALVAGALVVAAVVFGGLALVVRYGPRAGLAKLGRVLAGAGPDLVCMSPRRVWALTWLSVRDALSRRIVLVFFFVILFAALSAAWFLDPASTEPARLYLGNVLSFSNFLVLVSALLLGAFSLPADIKNKSIYTVTTKPVRASEIVLGRILGITLIGTILLAVMSAVSFVFVVRGLEHTHELSADDLRPEAGPASSAALVGYTGHTNNHRHRVRIETATGKGVADSERRHLHAVDRTGEDYRVGGQDGMLLARVPVYGILRFRDDKGVDTDQGICVGDEWTYRGFIAGASKARAIWEFSGVTPMRYPSELRVEMNIGVFRTYKGDDMSKGVLGSLSVRNPRTGLTARVSIFESKEFTTFQVVVPRKLEGVTPQFVQRRIETGAGFQLIPPNEQRDDSLLRRKSFDLFDDFVDDGKLEIWLGCEDGGQYLGAAQPDMYLRLPNSPFWINFFKGYYGIWLQMLLMVSFGVMFSTFVSGPVAALGTLGVWIGGYFNTMLLRVATGKQLGGGVLENMVRMFRQDNQMSPLPDGMLFDATRILDQAGSWLMRPVASILPPFNDFGFSEFVASGYYIAWDPWIVVLSLRALAYVIPAFVAGYFFLKTRGVAR